MKQFEHKHFDVSIQLL